MKQDHHVIQLSHKSSAFIDSRSNLHLTRHNPTGYLPVGVPLPANVIVGLKRGVLIDASGTTNYMEVPYVSFVDKLFDKLGIRKNKDTTQQKPLDDSNLLTPVVESEPNQAAELPSPTVVGEDNSKTELLPIKRSKKR